MTFGASAGVADAASHNTRDRPASPSSLTRAFPPSAAVFASPTRMAFVQLGPDVAIGRPPPGDVPEIGDHPDLVVQVVVDFDETVEQPQLLGFRPGINAIAEHRERADSSRFVGVVVPVQAGCPECHRSRPAASSATLSARAYRSHQRPCPPACPETGVAPSTRPLPCSS